MKILFVSNIAPERVGSFSLSSIKAASALGYEYHLASNFMINSRAELMKEDEEKYGITLHQIDFVRNPLRLGNIKAYKQLVALIKKEKIDIIHCNTPVGGLLGRLAGKHCGINKVIYFAHGFHFYYGAPLINWLIYYPVERILAHYTDVLITLNKEDYSRAKAFKLRNGGKVYYVPGVGINTNNPKLNKDEIEISKKKYLKELEVPEDSVLLLSAGELNKNKNYHIVIKAIGELKNNRIHYFICGEGAEKQSLIRQAERYGISSQIHLLGYRKDIHRLYQISDVFLLPSLREGLSRSLMEAMVYGLPVIASKIRGNTDWIEDYKGGILCDPRSCRAFLSAISFYVNNKSARIQAGNENRRKAENLDINIIIEQIKKIYQNI